jgi:hypothetical protein
MNVRPNASTSTLKGSLVLVAPACAGEGPDHFGSYVRSLSLYFYNWLFLGLEPMTSSTLKHINTQQTHTLGGEHPISNTQGPHAS